MRLADDPSLAVHVLHLGLACCELEVEAAIQLGLLLPDEPSPGASDADRACSVLLIAGTVTRALIPAVLRAWDRLPEPRIAVAFGACADSGGPYWDAPTVANGIGDLIPVRGYVPGCPPQPRALVAGLRALARGCSAEGHLTTGESTHEGHA